MNNYPTGKSCERRCLPPEFPTISDNLPGISVSCILLPGNSGEGLAPLQKFRLVA